MKYSVHRLILAGAIAAIALIPLGASAHSVGFDKEISATLHFAPDDEPAAGIPSTIKIIDIKDQGNRFTAAGCECALEIVQSDRLLSTVKLAADKSDLAVKYTFPARGNYELHLRGTPRAGADFVPFNIIYAVQIDRQGTASVVSSDAYLLAGIAALLVIVSIVAARMLRPTQSV